LVRISAATVETDFTGTEQGEGDKQNMEEQGEAKKKEHKDPSENEKWARNYEAYVGLEAHRRLIGDEERE
jgi:hypothetical protein